MEHNKKSERIFQDFLKVSNAKLILNGEIFIKLTQSHQSKTF